jgi:hypothetical protein
MPHHLVAYVIHGWRIGVGETGGNICCPARTADRKMTRGKYAVELKRQGEIAGWLVGAWRIRVG